VLRAPNFNSIRLWRLLLFCLLCPTSLFASRHGRDLPNSQNGQCTSTACSSGTVVYLAAYPNVQLSGSNFSLVITPYLWGSVSADLSSVNLSSTLFDVKLTPTDSNNTNTKLVAVFIGANLANAGYITTDTNNPVPVPSTPDLGNQLSFSDPLSGVDSGYTLWALGPNSAQSPNSPQEVVLVVDNTPSTA